MSLVQPWFVRMLGKLELRQGQGSTKTLRNGRDACLLAYLAFYLDQEHAREQLAERFWGEQPDPGAHLRGSLTRLRSHLEPHGIPQGAILLASRARIALNPELVETDVRVMGRLCQRASKAPTPHRYRLLQEAATLYQGELLPLQVQDWIIPEREELAFRHYTLLLQLARLAEELGERDKAISFALAASASPSEEEGACHTLVQLYAASGRSQEALNALRRFTRRHQGAALSESLRALATELRRNPQGLVKPAASLESAAQTVQGASPPSLAELRSTTAPKDLPRPLHTHLPRPVTAFFGRQREKENLIRLLTGPAPRRLITLLGMGGLGKTRLALEVGQSFPGNVFYVELATPSSTEELQAALLAAIDPHHQQQQHDKTQERLVAALTAPTSSPCLLILDNAELATQEAAQQVLVPLLHHVPQLSCLVGSRRALLPELEQQVPLLPLPLPQEPEDFSQLYSSPSVQLFLDRAQARKLDFKLTRGNAAAIAQLVTRLEGIPLAIELAAARAGTLSPAQMQEQMAHPTEFLVDRRNQKPERHHSLAAALQGTCALLEPDTQVFFQALSVFQGGFTAEAADSICGIGDIEQTRLQIEQLREVALIVESSTPLSDDTMRFALLETVRSHAQEQLNLSGKAALFSQRHESYYTALLEAARTPLLYADPEQSKYQLARIQLELDNIRAALQHALHSPDGANAALNLAGNLRYYFEATGLYGEGRQHLKAALAHPDAPQQETEYQKALNHAGILASYQGDWSEARRYCYTTLKLRRVSKSRYREAVALHNLGQILQRQGKLGSARVLYERSLAIEEELAGQEGENQLRAQQGLADSHHNLARLALIDRRYEDAHGHLEKCLPEYQRTQNQLREGLTWSNFGLLYLHTRQPLQAEQSFDRVLELSAQLQDKRLLATGLSGIGQLRRQQGDLEAAETFLKSSLENEVAIGNQTGIAESLGEVARLLVQRGKPEEQEDALRLLAAEESLRLRIYSPRYAPDLVERDELLEYLRQVLGEPRFKIAWATGRAMSTTDAIERVQKL